MNYYDLILGLIPGSFLVVVGVLSAAGIGITIAVPIAATLSIGLIGHAMFVRSPVKHRPDRVETQPATPQQQSSFQTAD